MFMHNDVWYKQIDGVAMGSPLAPTLANMFLAHIETDLFNNIDRSKHAYYPKLFLRYVDDCYALFDSTKHHTKFLNTLNSLHPNLKFTV